MLRGVIVATTVLILLGARSARAPAQCVGDCDGNGAVAVAEIVVGVDIALARRPIEACTPMDADNNHTVSIPELTSAVGFALIDCPPEPTPTATPPACGDPVIAARFPECVRSSDETECVSAGGQWGPYPFSQELGCFCPTGQGGCPCSTTDDCLAFCTAPIPGDFGSCAQVEMGTCGAMTPQAGCFCTPSFSGDANFIALCVDP